ncbi:hypothetical protein M0R45_022595 [Rubus argutus]|uniref:Uncharacterized protein n=1 Tax=Rubus argutus TaxID=59490 RepID=A0AAW1XGI3_RUBAR
MASQPTNISPITGAHTRQYYLLRSQFTGAILSTERKQKCKQFRFPSSLDSYEFKKSDLEYAQLSANFTANPQSLRGP